ncbi:MULTISPECIES: TetR/AcrR family transcriptional regulator [Saccharibacillus]|uniref:TetR/AcrR family transcriptional regulator n=1 Tax=Saccharibacillus TaxID=456492 RepID=UPI00123A3B27|nr:TetR family transcriptional regulator [Saccharibacillus sp. WB 17]MWJ31602.1 TetR family transcriptional regulator [Saccharibacillus sp. WB 17]
MPEPNYSLREIKKARTRIKLYEAGLDLMRTRKFSEIMVDDICREAETSKVTFFKCFPQKEALLVYFMRAWLTERMLEIDDGGRRGFASIRHLLAGVADGYEARPGVMPGLIAFLAEKDMHPCMPDLSAAEIHLLFPGREEEAAATPDLSDLFERCMLEARSDGTLDPDLPIDEAVKLLWTIFYGAFLTARLYASDDIRGFYDLHLRVMERG